LAARTDKPPKPELRVRDYGASQAGYLFHSEWVSGPSIRDGHPICVSNHGEGPRRFRKPLLVEPGEEAIRILLHTPRRPSTVSIETWRELDASGQPVGSPESVDLNLRRRPNGRWRLGFTANIPPSGDYYLELYGRWRDKPCEANEYASWTFHIRAS